jgi:Outer membrane protein beta-barrel domain
MAGFVASQVDGDSYSGYNKAGLQGGVFVRTSFTKVFGAQLEIHYTGKGARKPVSSEDPEVYKVSLHYIDVPVLASIGIKQVAAVELGLVPGYLFAKSGEDSGGKLPDEYLVSYKNFDLATLVGIRFNITEKLGVNFRYQYSLVSIRDGDSGAAYYAWPGKLFSDGTGDYNNYLTLGIYWSLK